MTLLEQDLISFAMQNHLDVLERRGETVVLRPPRFPDEDVNQSPDFCLFPLSSFFLRSHHHPVGGETICFFAANKSTCSMSSQNLEGLCSRGA